MGTELQARPLPGWLPGWVRRAWTEPGGSWRPPARDIAIAGAVTVIAVLAAYGEAHPTTPGRYFTGGAPPAAHARPPRCCLSSRPASSSPGGTAIPRLVLCASTAAVVAYTLPGYENGVALLLPAMALVTIATRFRVRVSVAWAVAVTARAHGRYRGEQPARPVQRRLLAHPREQRGRAVRRDRASPTGTPTCDSARVQVARQAALEAQRRVDEERLRIARELHDVVAHTMATITVQAAAASQLLRDRPDEAAESLQAIRAASKDGLRELRAILDVLRSASGGSEETADPTQPTPGLARLDALVEGVGAAGLPVTVDGHRTATRPARDHRPVRVPHHPGGADQHDPPRRPRHRGRDGGLRRGRAARGGHRHRARPRPPPPRGRLCHRLGIGARHRCRPRTARACASGPPRRAAP